jgi:hypothetical protein
MILAFDIDTDNVWVSTRGTEHMPTEQPPSELSVPAPLSSLTDQTDPLYFSLLFSVLTLAPEQAFNNIASVVITRNVVIEGTAVRTLEYKVSRG